MSSFAVVSSILGHNSLSSHCCQLNDGSPSHFCVPVVGSPAFKAFKSERNDFLTKSELWVGISSSLGPPKQREGLIMRTVAATGGERPVVPDGAVLVAAEVVGVRDNHGVGSDHIVGWRGLHLDHFFR